jgi:hypothetical protein
MPVVDNGEQSILTQSDFSGGMNCANPSGNQYKDALNIVIRDGRPTTRPGVRRYLKADGGYETGFYFNQENSKQNDALHTGFWFPFDFVQSPWGIIQGAELIRLSIHDRNKIIFASGGAVYIYEDGYVTGVPATVGSDETVEFVQANDKIYMFRSGDNHPLVWDGAETGFVVVPEPAPGTGESIPHGETAVYHAGRMWVPVDDDIFASAALDPSTYDFVGRSWSVNKGEGEFGVVLYPFHEDILLAFKRRRIVALGQINAVVLSGGSMADYVVQNDVDQTTGLVARHAAVTIGEDVWYLGYGGIYSLSRNAQNKTQLQPVAVSEPIKSYIQRINWPAVSCACATVHDNYVIFAVPVDSSTTNNLLLVYDKLVQAWVGPWSGYTLNPVRFFHDNEKLIFLSADGVVRQMFTDDAWDSEDPYADVPVFDVAVIYEPGEAVYYELAGDRLYVCVETTQGNLPTDTTYWEEITDVWGMYAVESMLETKQFKGEVSPLRLSRAGISLEHQNALLELSQTADDFGTEKVIYSGVEYPRDEYDVVLPDWDETNVNDDFEVPNRKDYTLMVGLNGIYCFDGGLTVGIWEKHILRWMPLTVNVQSIGVRVRNARGKMRVGAVQFMVAPRRFAAGEIV